MSTTLTIEVPVFFQPVGRCGRKALHPAADQLALPPGRVPRVARLMALALRLDELVRTGKVASYSALATLGHVTRARICQIMSLLHLEPDITRSAAVSSADRRRPRCPYPGRPDAHRRRLRLAQATTPVAATGAGLTHLAQLVLTPTCGQRIGHVGPGRLRAAGSRRPPNEARPRQTLGLAEPTLSSAATHGAARQTCRAGS
jgi:hypothetical protein